MTKEREMNEQNAEYVLYKERWLESERAFFEYHCYEGHDSGDAEAWYHSHQEVIIISGPSYDAEPVDSTPEPWPDAIGRAEEGIPWCYQVRFPDGLEYTVFEDELMTSPEGYFRPAPPARIDSSGA